VGKCSVDRDTNGLEFASRHPTCFYGTGPVSASYLCVSSDHSCSQTRRDSSESNFREPKKLAHDNEMILPQQTRDENASSFLSTKLTPHTPNFPSRGKKSTQKCPTHECEANLLFLFLSERYHTAKQSVSNTSLAGVDTTVRFHKARVRTRSISLSFFRTPSRSNTMDLRETEYEYLVRIHLAYDKV